MNKIRSAVYAFACGDALGVPVESYKREILKKDPVIEMKGFGKYNVPEGVWSDDTSTTLATMDSIATIKKIDYNDIAKNFVKWLFKAEYTATGEIFDNGNTVGNAIYNYATRPDKTTDAIHFGLKNERNNGNGSLMRMLPIAFYCYSKNSEDSEIYEIVKNTSSITHAHEISILGCYIYVNFVINLLKGKDKKESYKILQDLDYSRFSEESQNLYNRILKNDISLLSEDDINSSGFVIDSLEASLWAILTQNNLKDTIISAVNLGRDTDTIGAITGSLAGIIYNYDEIPTYWIEKLKNKELIDKIIDKFYNELK